MSFFVFKSDNGEWPQHKMHLHLRFCRTGNPLYFASSKMNTKKLN